MSNKLFSYFFYFSLFISINCQKFKIPYGEFKVHNHIAFPISALDENDINKILGSIVSIRKEYISVNTDTCRNILVQFDTIKSSEVLYDVLPDLKRELNNPIPDSLLTISYTCKQGNWAGLLWYFFIYKQDLIFAERDGELFILKRIAN